MITLDQLDKHQSAVIESFEAENLPLKLIEMGCLPGNNVSLIHTTLFRDPIYLRIDQSHLVIRKETARHIMVKLK